MARRRGRKDPRPRAEKEAPPSAAISAAEAAPEAPPKRILDIATAAGALIPLAAYVATLSPTVDGGDSGEFITVAHVLGVAHPPGFPLHTLLAQLFTWVPFGSVASRVHFFSAVCDAAAAALLFRAVALWTGRLSAGALAAGAFAFSPLVWPYAITAEVFALNNLFAAGLLYASVALSRADVNRERALPLAFFWLGLGLSNHHILVFLAPAFAVYAWLTVRGPALDRRLIGRTAAAFALGLVPYLYLPLAAARAPAMAWGDAATWEGFFTHLLRREYGTFRLAHDTGGMPAGDLLRRLGLFVRAINVSTLFAGLPLLLAGAWSLRRPGLRALGTAWLASLALYLGVFCALANVNVDDPLHVMVQERFWQQAFVIVAAFMGVGLAELGRHLPTTAARVALPLLAIGLPIALVARNASAVDRRGQTFYRDYAIAVLDSLPPRAVLFVSSDDATGSIFYVRHVEGYRRDVTVIPTGHMTRPWFRRFASRALPQLRLPGTEPPSFRKFLDANLATFPVFVLNRVPWLATLEEAYRLWPAGLVEQVLPRGQEQALADWIPRAEQSFSRFDPRRAARFPVGSWERSTAASCWALYERFGLAVADVAARHPDDPAVQEAAVRAFEGVLARHPSPPPIILKNLGVAHQILARTRPDARSAMVRYWRLYLATGPKDDPDVPNIRLLIEQAGR